jgi:hypothetical protein
MDKTVTLSDGNPCAVRVLGLFELDEVAPDNAPGPFYEVVTGVDGKRVSTLYKPPAVPPEKPEIPREQVVQFSSEYEAWIDYEMYQQYVEHRQKEVAVMQKYRVKAKAKIMRDCLAREDRERVISMEDWNKVHGAALSAQLTEEDIAGALRNNFPGSFPEPGSPGDNEG